MAVKHCRVQELGICSPGSQGVAKQLLLGQTPVERQLWMEECARSCPSSHAVNLGIRRVLVIINCNN